VKKIIFAIALALLVMTSVVFSSQRFEPINELYVFGDSLSDVGNSFRATGELYPPNPLYFQGRFSNGPVWVEYLGDRLQLSARQINNFAYGGATTGSVTNRLSDNSYPNRLLPSLVSQVQTFTQSNQRTNSEALYILWAGANDYLQGVTSVAAPIENVRWSLAALASTGAKKFLVANLPDLGKLPATRSSANSARLSQLTQSHNQGLRRSLKLFAQQHPEFQIATLDANTLYREATTNPAAFGLANVTSACLTGSVACAKPDQFLFWDGIHPTTVAHRILGETAFRAIQDAGMVNAPSAAQQVR